MPGFIIVCFYVGIVVLWLVCFVKSGNEQYEREQRRRQKIHYPYDE